MKKAVFIVLAVTLLAFGMATSAMAIDGLARANAVVVNPGGLGDSLIYGYYNVRGNLNLFNIVNTTSAYGEKVRVVFRAGADSEEVLDFSVCLSQGDVWTAFLLDNGTTAAICPFDSDTVTAPAIPANCQAFKIPTGSSLKADDLREGYFEVLGLSTIPGYDKNTTALNIIKTAADCASWHSASNPSAVAGAIDNVLMGNNTIIDAGSLATYSYNAAALGYTSEAPFLDPGPGSELDVTQLLGNSCGAMDVALAKTDVITPYDIMAGIGGETSLIVTFPTRRACWDGALGGIFNCTKVTSGHCVTFDTAVTTAVWDDTEKVQNILDFSPAGGNVLPNEVNVLNIGGSNVWNSTLAQSFTVSIGTGLGWVDVNLVSNAAPFGLPALTYTTQSFAGGAASYMVPAAYHSIFTPLN